MTEPFTLTITSNANNATIDNDSKTTIAIMGLNGSPIATRAFLKALKNDVAPESGLLPPGVRWVSHSRKIWLFEQPPMTMAIEHSKALLEDIDDDTEKDTYELHLPWLAYLVDLDQTYYPDSIFVFALQHEIRSEKDLIGVLPLSNFSSGGKLCQPHRGDVGEQPANVGQGLDLAYRMVWSSGFNMDLDSNFAWCRGLHQPKILFPNDIEHPEKLTEDWSKLSTEEVEAITDWPSPNNFDRYITIEDLGNLYKRGAIYREQRERTGHPPKATLSMVLGESVRIDNSRRGDWGPKGLQMALQSAVSQAGLYE